jgi:F-type H+-transporting ATPase subunit a
MISSFGKINLDVSIGAKTVFSLFGLNVTNSMIIGTISFLILTIGIIYSSRMVKKGKSNKFTRVVRWAFDILVKQIDSVMPSKKSARAIAPLAITIFFFVLVNYWLISIIPGVGAIKYNGVAIFRGLDADLNFTCALAIITIVGVQIYAIKYLGFLKNAGRYFRNPFKDPIGATEGLLELIGEFSRCLSLSLRLFGNALAGEILLLVISAIAGFLSTLALPLFMAFEIFIGFIQSYIFFMLCLIFTSLAMGNIEQNV